jgi:hypothetical protein
MAPRSRALAGVGRIVEGPGMLGRLESGAQNLLIGLLAYWLIEAPGGDDGPPRLGHSIPKLTCAACCRECRAPVNQVVEDLLPRNLAGAASIVAVGPRAAPT